MPIVDISVAQNELAKLLETASSGEEVIITQSDHPVARLVAIRPRIKLRKPGSMAGKIWIAEDFDAPLPDDIQAAFEGN
jgi:prevent-host-death family protein